MKPEEAKENLREFLNTEKYSFDGFKPLSEIGRKERHALKVLVSEMVWRFSQTPIAVELL